MRPWRSYAHRTFPVAAFRANKRPTALEIDEETPVAVDRRELHQIPEPSRPHAPRRAAEIDVRSRQRSCGVAPEGRPARLLDDDGARRRLDRTPHGGRIRRDDGD